jgi:hypothetical protein
VTTPDEVGRIIRGTESRGCGRGSTGAAVKERHRTGRRRRVCVEAELRASRLPESRLDDPAYGEPGDQPGLVVSRVLVEARHGAPRLIRRCSCVLVRHDPSRCCSPHYSANLGACLGAATADSGASSVFCGSNGSGRDAVTCGLTSRLRTVMCVNRAVQSLHRRQRPRCSNYPRPTPLDALQPSEAPTPLAVRRGRNRLLTRRCPASSIAW